ncbi:hypothetical protein ES703_54824 [subsurface metagenome]
MSFIPAFKIGIWNAWIFITIFLWQMLLMRLINKEAFKKSGHPSDMELDKREKIASIIFTFLTYLSYIYTIFLPLKLATLWFYIGLVIFILGLFILIIATINFSTTSLNQPVTKGIYRYCRHPMYFANFIIFLGTGIASASWIIIIVSIAFLILANIYVASEERFCLKKYGNLYKKYINRTPKWVGIPKP